LDRAAGLEFSGMFSRYLHRPEIIVVFGEDWLTLDFALPCCDRINRRFAEMGFPLEVPTDLPEMTHYPRRPRTIWGTLFN
jgi:hypothetical protein